MKITVKVRGEISLVGQGGNLKNVGQMCRMEMGHIDGPNNNGAAVSLRKSWDVGRKGEIFW